MDEQLRYLKNTNKNVLKFKKTGQSKEIPNTSKLHKYLLNNTIKIKTVQISLKKIELQYLIIVSSCIHIFIIYVYK